MADEQVTPEPIGVNDACWIESSVTYWDEEDIESNPNKRLLFRAKKHKFESVINILSNVESSRLALLHDDNMRTAAHYAAMHQGGEAALKQLVHKFGTACLTNPDVDKITPLHLSARYHTAESWEEYYKALKFVSLSKFTDSNGDTCAHWAAKNTNDPKMVLKLEEITATTCLKWKNNREETVLQHVLQYCSNKEVVEKILKKITLESDLLKKVDIDGNTAFHSAARSHIDALEFLLPKTTTTEQIAIINVLPTIARGKSLVNEALVSNSRGETVLHLALQHCSEAMAEQLIECVSSMPWWLKQVDKQGNTCLHLLAQCPGRDEVLLKAINFAEEQEKNIDQRSDRQPRPVQKGFHDLLLVKNKRKSTVLHYVIENCRPETVETLLNRFSSCEVSKILTCDNSGNTIFHLAAKRKDKDKILPIMLRVFQQYTQYVSAILSRRNHKNQSVLHLAIDAVFDENEMEIESFRMENLIENMPRVKLNRVDSGGNTLLHALMQSQLNYRGVARHILSRFKLLVRLGVNFSAENDLSQNCLHATKLDKEVLCQLLDLVSFDEEAKVIFEKMLFNSTTGAHIVHVFSGQYELQSTLTNLVKVHACETSQDELIRLKVNLDPCKNAEHGETCLHYACAYGHKDNIVFLLKKGLSLWSKTHFGKTCVDCAMENGNFDYLAQAVRDYNLNRQQIETPASESVDHSVNLASSSSMHGDFPFSNRLKEIKYIDVLRLLDPPQRALKLPDREAARQILVSITNDFGTSGANTRKADGTVLLKALEMDSKRIFRAALSLGMVGRNTETVLVDRFFQAIKIDESIRRSFARQNIFRHLNQIDSGSELPLLDLAAFFYRDEILPDLILTRQFELIPCCLSLLITLGPEITKMRVKAKGKHEQLLRLQNKITNIAVNALNELFVNANTVELQLLFKYIKGEMTEGGEQAPKNFGPRFPYRECDANGMQKRVAYGTVLDLVKEADCADLFATDCIYSLTNEDWRQPVSKCSQRHGVSQKCIPFSCCPNRCNCGPKVSKFNSPRAKFWTNIGAFVSFLGFLGWYILYFHISFNMPGVDAVLWAYLLSFAFQEVAEFRRQRKVFVKAKIGTHVWSIPAYLTDLLNYFDVVGILFLFAGLVARLCYYLEGAKLEEAYPSQMLLSTSFAFFCIRSLSFLSIFEGIGPMIAMLWSLIFYDLLPFLFILFLIFCCFGVFFTTLLFSFVWNPSAHLNNPFFGWEVFVYVATLPFNILFNNFDHIKLTESTNSTILGKEAIKPGYEWFYDLLLFIFMGFVNVVMMNLLIALFNLRVTQMYGVAIGIWRRKCFQMLQEYKKMTPFPFCPPFSFLAHIFFLFKKLHGHFNKNSQELNCRKRRVVADNSAESDTTNQARWWQDKARYPADYKRFLEFQAIQFHRCRSRLLRDTQWNRNDFDVVKAHTENELSQMKSEMQEMLEDLKHQTREGRHRHDEPTNGHQKADEGGTSADTRSQPEATESRLGMLEELKKQQQQLEKTEERQNRIRKRIKAMDSKLEQLLALAQQKQQSQ